MNSSIRNAGTIDTYLNVIDPPASWAAAHIVASCVPVTADFTASTDIPSGTEWQK